jgi:uncharacterized membrane protein YbhN (UPF0104 family)
VVTLACFPVGGDNWRAVMRAFGVSMSWVQSYRILYVSNLAKYLPGGVWNLFGRVALSRAEGVSTSATSIAIFLEFLAQSAAMCTCALATLGSAADAHVPIRRWMLAPGVALVLVCAHPKVVNLVLGLISRVTKLTLPKIELSYGYALQILARYLLNWLLLSGGFVLLARAVVGRVDAETSLLLVGAVSISWFLSVLAFIVPGGVGVREMVLVSLLKLQMTAPVAAALALAFRLWVIVIEVIAFAVAVSLRNVRVESRALDP